VVHLLRLLLLLLLMLLMHVKLLLRLLLRRQVELLHWLWLLWQSVIVSLVNICLRSHFHVTGWAGAVPLARLEIFDSFDCQKETLLVTQLVKADVLQVLDGDLSHILNRHITLAPQLSAVF